MKVTVEKPQIISLLYTQERSDPDYGSCLWARFYLDTQNYTMSIESDCGYYSHGWVPTPDHETFLHLLCRMDQDYLLCKLAEQSVVSGDDTWEALKELVQDTAECEDLEIKDSVWDDLKGACYHQRDAREVHDSVFYALEYTAMHDKLDSFSVYECIVMDYTANAKKIVDVFRTDIVPVLKEMEVTNAEMQ